MTKTSDTDKGKNHYMAGSIFLVILALLFILNVLIRFPFRSPIRVSERGIVCLEEPGRQWFLLESGDYTVNGAFNDIKIRSSAIPLLSKGYTYYSITVKTNDGSFAMAVRVTAKKAQDIERRESVRLYGMVSKLDDESDKLQQSLLKGQAVESLSVCLNDNGDTVTTRMISAAIFALLSVGCIWLTIIIHRR